MKSEQYVLATGDAGADRLHVVHLVHGADTADLFRRLGDLRGKQIADIGCGIGAVSCFLAKVVGEEGKIWGIDQSEGQIAHAKQNAAKQGLQNTRFQTANAYATGLPKEAFDIAFCRFVLMHTQEPQRILTEMLSLLKPGGWLVVEDGDFTTPSSLPVVPAVERVMHYYRLAGQAQNADFEIGKHLHKMVIEAGANEVQARLVQPAYLTGIEKRLPAWTLEEVQPYLLQHGLATETEIAETLQEVEQVIQDESHLMTMVRVTQVWGRK